MVKTFQAYLPNECHRKYSCVHCRAHLANHDELISKSFQGSQGRAYLFNSVVNVGCGPAEERVLLTGLHAVADIFCECCKTTLGWKYEHAFESSQKYKEGKFIIELAHMIKDNGWAWLGWQTDNALGFWPFFTDHCRMWCVLPYDDEGKVDLGPGKLCHCCRLGLLSLCVWVGCRTVFMSLSFISLRKSLSMDQLIRIHRKLDLNGILSHTHTHTQSWWREAKLSI